MSLCCRIICAVHLFHILCNKTVLTFIQMDLDDNVRSILTCLQNFLSETNLSCSVSLTVDPSAVCSINASQLNTHLKKLVTSLQSLVHDQMSEGEDESQIQSTSSQSVVEDDNQKPAAPGHMAVVQISASNAEIDRRIRAFMDKKQVEVDDINRREFHRGTLVTTKQHHSPTNSCARRDAVFRPRDGCKSHVKVSRVVNTHGPQTRPTMVSYHQHSKRSPLSRARRSFTRFTSQQGIEERLHNMESHLKIRADEQNRTDVYQRLKDLESRILSLEGLSPEYFDAATQSMLNLQQQSESHASDMADISIQEIDSRIKELQESLLGKSSETSQQVQGTGDGSLLPKT